MITTNKAWEDYNTLANRLRDAIVHRAIGDLSIGILGEFRFVNNELDTFNSVCGENVIVGITVENNEVKLIFENSVAMDDNFSLYSESVHLIDLIGVLELLEQYIKRE